MISSRIEGRLAILTLNRPQAINALDGGMIAALHAHLLDWIADDRVAAVLIEGEGARGFCAGGDVRAVRRMLAEGDAAGPERYFRAEYGLDGLIATYPKPVVSLAHGATMGGGIGLSGHARYRFCLPDTRFAMPEPAIGFIADVGVNAILARTTPERALLFLMAGLPVGPGDALALGLADALVEAGARAALVAELIAAAGSDRPETAIALAMQARSIEPGETPLCDLADRHAQAFAGADAQAIVSALEAAGDAALAPYVEALRGRCPASIEAGLQGHRRARRKSDIAQVLAQDLALAVFMAGRPDFAEGVRAVLVDKDQRPTWSPAGFSPALAAEIAAVLADVPPWPAKTFALRLG